MHTRIRCACRNDELCKGNPPAIAFATYFDKFRTSFVGGRAKRGVFRAGKLITQQSERESPMNIIKKFQFAAWSVLFAAGLAVSSAVYADGQSDVANYCSGCHGVTVNGVVVASDGAKNCLQRTATEWEATINRMNGKGCNTPPVSIAGMASYLAGVGSTSTSTLTTTSLTTTSSTTTTTWIERCNPMSSFGYSVSPSSLSFTSTQGGPLPGSQLLSVWVLDNGPAMASWAASNIPTWLSISPAGGGEGAPYDVIASVNTTQLSAGVYTAIINFNFFDGCYRHGALTVTVTFNIDPSTSTTNTSTTSTTTTSSTPTTTLCNTYVNGTTQYPYSGSGSCHGFAIDDMSGAHIVRDQSYCKKHMSHFNSKGNHVHSYPHPMCM